MAMIIQNYVHRLEFTHKKKHLRYDWINLLYIMLQTIIFLSDHVTSKYITFDT